MIVDALTIRERFFAHLFTAAPSAGDAAILLAGEDTEPRAAVATELVRINAAPSIVITGGRSGPPRHVSAPEVYATLLGKGLHPDRLIVEGAAQHTQAQASAVVAMAIEREWTRLLLVASAYHMPRAFLTFLKALDDAARAATICLVPVCAKAAWCESPVGMQETRSQLLESEVQKIDTYKRRGHVATYTRGLSYLKTWERQR